MTLGFIGSGMIGGALARLAVAAGMNVVMSNSRGPGTLADLVAELGPRARAATAAEAARAGDIVVTAVPQLAYHQLPADALAGKTVIDTLNYYPDLRDLRIPELDSDELTSSGLLQRHLAGSRVVKAFNNVDCLRLVSLARPSGAVDRTAVPVAGDDPEAKAEVVRLVDALGFDAVDIGTLAESWRSEPNTPVYIVPYFPAEPAGLSPAEFSQWFRAAPGVPVSADRVKALTYAAVRGPAGGDRGFG
ncbi:NAD(P)-binding domain-containing protein [Longispora urticae]